MLPRARATKSLDGTPDLAWGNAQALESTVGCAACLADALHVDSVYEAEMKQAENITQIPSVINPLSNRTTAQLPAGLILVAPRSKEFLSTVDFVASSSWTL